MKVQGVLGGERGDDEEVTILNRTLRWRGDKIKYEADFKHAKVICEELGLEPDSKGLGSLIIKENAEDLDKDDPELGKTDAARF